MRASVIAGGLVQGPMLITRIRISGLPVNPQAPQHNGVMVTTKPVMRVVWRGMALEDLWCSLPPHWARLGGGPTSLVRRLPRVYESQETWGGPTPQELLAKALQAMPESSIVSSASSISVGEGSFQAAGASTGVAAHDQRFTCSMTLSAMGSEFTAEAEAVGAAEAREAAALDAIHKLERLTVRVLMGRDVEPSSLAEAAAAPDLQWRSPGGGEALRPGCTVKGEATVSAAVRGQNVVLERCSLHSRVGCGAWTSAVDAALLHMRAGSTATVNTSLPFLGHDPTGQVQRVPVCVSIAVAATLPGQVRQRVFTPPLATQRHTLIRELITAHRCTRVVDFGCGEGSWIKSLLLDPEENSVAAVLGVDVSPSALQRGCKRILAALYKRQLTEELKGKPAPTIQLNKGSVTHGALAEAAGWGQWRGCDAALACEVVEHVHDPDAFAQGLLHALRPRLAVVSTPNMEYNSVIRFCAPQCDADPLKPLGSDGRPMRDRDHKFEWTRAEFEAWAARQAAAHGYGVTFRGTGLAMEHSNWRLQEGNGGRDVGLATQVAVFLRNEDAAVEGGTGELDAESVLDTRQLSQQGLQANAQELHKAISKERDGGLHESVDAMLQALQGFDLDDDDVND